MAEAWEYRSIVYAPGVPQCDQELADAGRAGWEAVGISSDSYGTHGETSTKNYVLLKRRIAR